MGHYALFSQYFQVISHAKLP